MFIEELAISTRVGGVSMYLLYTFEPLHDLHLGISKLVKVCTVKYLSSDNLVAGRQVKGEKSFLKI